MLCTPWKISPIWVNPEIPENTRNTRKYPKYPEIPEIPGYTRKKKRYPEIPDRIFRHSYPTRTRPATRYFVQYPTRPDPILKNPTRWALHRRQVVRVSRAGPIAPYLGTTPRVCAPIIVSPTAFAVRDRRSDNYHEKENVNWTPCKLMLLPWRYPIHWVGVDAIAQETAKLSYAFSEENQYIYVTDHKNSPEDWGV